MLLYSTTAQRSGQVVQGEENVKGWHPVSHAARLPLASSIRSHMKTLLIIAWVWHEPHPSLRAVRDGSATFRHCTQRQPPCWQDVTGHVGGSALHTSGARTSRSGRIRTAGCTPP